MMVALSGLFQLLSAVLSVIGMRYRYAMKSPYIRNAEWGLVAIFFAGACTTSLQAVTIYYEPGTHVWMPTVILRIASVWIPLNYILYIKQQKKNERRIDKN